MNRAMLDYWRALGMRLDADVLLPSLGPRWGHTVTLHPSSPLPRVAGASKNNGETVTANYTEAEYLHALDKLTAAGARLDRAALLAEWRSRPARRIELYR